MFFRKRSNLSSILLVISLRSFIICSTTVFKFLRRTIRSSNDFWSLSCRAAKASIAVRRRLWLYGPVIDSSKLESRQAPGMLRFILVEASASVGDNRDDGMLASCRRKDLKGSEGSFLEPSVGRLVGRRTCTILGPVKKARWGRDWCILGRRSGCASTGNRVGCQAVGGRDWNGRGLDSGSVN